MLIQTPFFYMLCFNKVLALGFLKAYSNKVGATKKIKADPKRGFFLFYFFKSIKPKGLYVHVVFQRESRWFVATE